MELDTYIRNRLSLKPICLMTHVIAGYPNYDDNMRALEIMAQHDVDLVEIQMPFSEPTADGPVFVRANQRALESGVSTDSYFGFFEQAAAAFDFPLLMMGYYNPVFKMGELNFIQRLKQVGGSGFIIADLPVAEGRDFYRTARQQQLNPILIIAPTTPEQRMKTIANVGSGFVYVVARSGVTGKQTQFNADFDRYIDTCRNLIDLPLAVGFGVSSKKDLDFLTERADIAIIGTALLKSWEQNGASGLNDFFNSLNQD